MKCVVYRTFYHCSFLTVNAIPGNIRDWGVRMSGSINPQRQFHAKGWIVGIQKNTYDKVLIFLPVAAANYSPNR
jgi:hypothetical protein